MPIVTSIFLAISLALSVMLGSQLRPWTWGPAMISLGIAALAAAPVLARRNEALARPYLLALLIATIGWFACRALTSPVVSLGRADLLLLCGAVGGFLAIQSLAGHALASRIFWWCLATIMIASLWVAGRQVVDPSFTPIFGSRAASQSVTGFFGHYNYGANFLIGASLFLGGVGLLGRHHWLTRLLWILIAACGIAAIFLSKSRGGILGASVGCAVLAAAALVAGKRSGSRWFAPSVVAVPLIGAAVLSYLLYGWAQRSGGSIHQLFDNDVRLYLIGIALSCIGLHPLVGGGSRSFDWECFQFIDSKFTGMGASRPEMVHNELMQAASEYGLIGAGLLLSLLLAIMMGGAIRMMFDPENHRQNSLNGWRAGGLAAMAGILMQSMFSFVFHMIPSAILLGISAGLILRPQQQSRSGSSPRARRRIATRRSSDAPAEDGPSEPKKRRPILVRFWPSALAILAISCASLLIPAGWKASHVISILWPSYLAGKKDLPLEKKIDALDRAIRINPTPALIGDRAKLHHQAAATATERDNIIRSSELALADYQRAEQLHPFEPFYPINRGRLLGSLGRNPEAVEAIQHGIQLQGGMEAGFRGHFMLAMHHLERSQMNIDTQSPDDILNHLRAAAEAIETSAAKMGWPRPDMHAPRLQIHELLGIAYESANETSKALASYEFASSLRGGRKIHYRTALLRGKLALDDWTQGRIKEALSGFSEARRLVSMAGGELPGSFNDNDRKEYIRYLDTVCGLLKKSVSQLEQQ